MRGTTSIRATLIAVLSGMALAAEPVEATRPMSQIAVSVYDFAHIGTKTLTQSEELAARIFALAKVDARWTARSLTAATAVVT